MSSLKAKIMNCPHRIERSFMLSIKSESLGVCSGYDSHLRRERGPIQLDRLRSTLLFGWSV